MTVENITPEQAKELIQQAQAEILTTYNEFVDKVTTDAVAEAKEFIEVTDKNDADHLLDDL